MDGEIKEGVLEINVTWLVRETRKMRNEVEKEEGKCKVRIERSRTARKEK